MTKGLFVLLACAGAAHAGIWQNGDLITHTQADWGGDANVDPGAMLLDASYNTVYAATFGVVVVGSTSGITMSFTDAGSVRTYLPSIGPFAPLNGAVLNPLSTASGALGGEVLGLELNVDFSDAGFLPGALGIPFGNLVLANFSTKPALDGLTVRQFLGDVNTLLGGGSSIFGIAGLGTTIGDVNASFSDGTPGTFAQDHLVAPASVSAVPEPSSRTLLIIAALALGCIRWLRGRNSTGHGSYESAVRKGAMSFGAIGLLVLGGSLALPFPAAADASASTSVSEPALCGSVCTPPISQCNIGGVSGGILSSITSLDGVEFAEARINLATGTAGVAVANDRGFSSADASHFDTWFCTDPIVCATLATPGSFFPVIINLHVSGFASLTPGAMNVSYSYNTNSLLGSSALGIFQFNFGEDGANDPHGNIGGQASFFDYHTGVQHDLNVDIVSQGFDTGMVAFGADLIVTSYIGGCAVAGCDLSKGIFTDVEGLSAQIDPGNDGSAQILNSLNTFQVGFTSDLPLVSADGRTAGAAVVATPEPNSLRLVLAAAIAALAWMARIRRRPNNLDHFTISAFDGPNLTGLTLEPRCFSPATAINVNDGNPVKENPIQIPI